MKFHSQNRFASALGFFLGAFTSPLLFKAAGLPGGWIFEGPAQFVLSVAATMGLMLVFSRVGDWVWSRMEVFHQSCRS